MPLKDSFLAKARFYDGQFRSLVRLTQVRGDASQKSEALVVMMNPGSCKPINQMPQADGFFDAKIDRTLGRICRLLKLRNWRSVDVINLSDKREALSRVFLRNHDNGDFARTSIFCEARRDELKGVLEGKEVIVLAWGCSERLSGQKEQALRILRELTGDSVVMVGLQPEGRGVHYYHPLVRSCDWVRGMDRLIGSGKA